MIRRYAKHILRVGIIFICAGLCAIRVISPAIAQSETYPLTRIATGLQNPRGVAILPDGRLVVAQAGTGFVSGRVADQTGKLSLFTDINNDGDYDDAGEIAQLFNRLPGYNILYHFNPGRDEIVGIGDVLVLDDGRIFYTLDDNFQVLSIVEVSPTFEHIGNFIESDGSLNSIAYDENRNVMYVTLSTSNGVSVVSMEGDILSTVYLPLMENNQQSVPSGVAVDPLTGDMLVTLFSGQLWDYYGSILSFVPGASKVIRINPETGDYSDEITGLTTAVDIATDDNGNRYVVEMTTVWATPTMSHDFDLYDPNALPDAGGYARFTGRVTLFPADHSEPVVLADGLDQPTNVTYHDGMLYISTGQGTPGRPIWGEHGLTQIVGELYTIALE